MQFQQGSFRAVMVGDPSSLVGSGGLFGGIGGVVVVHVLMNLSMPFLFHSHHMGFLLSMKSKVKAVQRKKNKI
jgi:hypothetical protein